jgi:hypothetical protein
MISAGKKIGLGIEFLILFFGIPLFIFFDFQIIHPSSILLPVLLGLILYFRFNKEFKFRDLIRLNISRIMVLKTLIIVLITGFALLALVLIFEKENLFDLPRKNPLIWLLLCIFTVLFCSSGIKLFLKTSGCLYLRVALRSVLSILYIIVPFHSSLHWLEDYILLMYMKKQEVCSSQLLSMEYLVL